MPPPPALSPKSVFLCYRRQDTEEVVERIYESLAGLLSADALFRDLDDIRPGEDFPTVLQTRLRECDVVLVFIGRDWLAPGAEGQPRLTEPGDHVRLEVQTALNHPTAQTLPVLVKRDAQMPAAAQLPSTIVRLARLQAMTVRSGGGYHDDVQQLARAIEAAAARSQALRAAMPTRQGLPSAGAGPDALAMPRARPLDESEWEQLLAAVTEDRLVVVCGAAFGADEGPGGPASRETPIAEAAAAALALTPPADRRRPLAALALECAQAGRRDEFARALARAAAAAPGVQGLDRLLSVEPLRLFVTSGVDRAIETALARTGRPLRSLAYSLARPAELEPLHHAVEAGEAVVLHAAGLPGGLDGDAAITDEDWTRFVRAMGARRPAPLATLFDGRDVLFIGGGQPRGFLEFWMGQARELGAPRLWVATSALDADPALARSVVDRASADVTVFDEQGTSRFVEEWVGRFARRGPAHLLPPAPIAPGPAAFATGIDAAPAEAPGTPARMGLSPQSPWPGLRSFQEQDAAWFHGRARATTQLQVAVRTHPVTLLVGRSGTGKSSIIRASLMPSLRARGLLPVCLRIDWRKDATPIAEQILRTAVEEAARAGVRAPAPAAQETPGAYFRRRDVVDLAFRHLARDDDPGRPRSRFVLIFDQFEEMLTLGDRPDVVAAWRDLADLVEGRIPEDLRQRCEASPAEAARYDFRAPGPHVLLALREDFMAELMALTTEMPSLGQSFVRLGPLTPAEALDVIMRGAPGDAGFEPAAAQELVRDLSSRGGSPFEGETIDPAVLSLMCAFLAHERTRRGRARIDLEMMGALGPDLLSAFYESAFADVAPEVRRWLEDELVSDTGTRLPMEHARAADRLQAAGLDARALDRLVDLRLLRMNPQGGANCVEFAHPMLATAALRSRRRRVSSPAGGGQARGLLGRLGWQGRGGHDAG